MMKPPVQGQTSKLAQGTVFFSQKFIFFFVLPVIHVKIKGSRPEFAERAARGVRRGAKSKSKE